MNRAAIITYLKTPHRKVLYTWWRWRSKWTRWRLEAIGKRTSHRPEDALLLFSTGRGGSTWLTEIVASLPGTATVYEPLQPTATPEFDALGIGKDIYIPQDIQWPEAREACAKMLSGRSLTWASTFHQRKTGRLSDYRTAERLLIKFVVAHGVASWLVRQFDFRHRPVLTLRHPMATIASRLRHGDWSNISDRYVIPEARFPEINEAHRDYLLSLHGTHRIHAALWCMQHLPVLSALRDGSLDVEVFFYEDILLNRERELARLFANWNLPMPADLVQRSTQRSITTKPGSPVSPAARLSFWRASFTPQEVAEMQEVLDHFDIRIYSGVSDTPIHDVLRG